MSLHFRIRSVLLHTQGSAVTLEPVEWGRWENADGTLVLPDEDITHDDQVDWVTCAPGEKWAEPVEGGGKATELRCGWQVPWRPDEYITFPDPTVFAWHGVRNGVEALHGGTTLGLDR